MYQAGNTVEQVFGGTVIKQGDRTPLGFNFRTENGELVYLTGSTVQVKVASDKGVVLEKQATISDDYTVQFAIGSQDITGAGNMRIEFIVTYPGGTIEKFPSDDWQRIRITSTLEDVEKYGVGYITFEQMKTDIDKKYAGFQNQLDSIVSDAGDSNLEIVQARVDKNGNTFSTLKKRIDAESDKIEVISERTRKLVDEFASLQEAINAGVPLKITPGVYVYDYLSIISNSDIEADEGAILKASSANLSTLVAINGSNIRIKGLTIDGDTKRSSGIRVINGSQNVTVEKCTIKNIYAVNEGAAGIKIEGNTKDVNIEKCVIDNVIGTPNTIVGDNIGVSRGVWVGKISSEPAPKNIKIDKCIIKNITPREDGDGICVQGWSERIFVTITNNFFTNCSKRAVKIMSPGVIVKHNQIENSYIGTDSTGYTDCMYAFISVYAGDTIVEGNQCLGGNSYHGIDIGTDLLGAPKNVKIINNEIIFDSTGLKPYYGAISLYTNTEDLDISGNTIVNTSKGIFIRKRLVGCLIRGNTIRSASLHGIHIDSYDLVSISDITIENNNIFSSQNPVNIQAGRVLVTGNNGQSGTGWGFVAIGGSAEVRLKGNKSDLYYSLPTPTDFYRDLTIMLRNVGEGDSIHTCVMNADNSTYRWTKSKTGTLSYNGDGTSTSKTIAHGLATTPNYWHVERASLDAGNAGIKYVSADATNLTVYFNTAPVTGTNNVVLKWCAEA